MAPRSKLIALLLTVLAAAFIAQYVRVWATLPVEQARTSDFAGTYAAATLWRDGDARLMYDERSEQRVLLQTGTPAAHLYIPFENPPAAAVLAGPFSLLDSALAYRVWSLLQMLLLGAAVVVAVRVAPWRQGATAGEKISAGAVALAGLGTGLVLLEGQWDGLVALGLAAGYALWARERLGWAGFAMGVAAAVGKPHLVLGILAFAGGRRDWRLLAGFAAGGVAAAGAGLLLAGPDATVAFVGALLKPSNNPLVQMQGASGLVASWLGGAWIALPLVVLLSLGGLALAARLGLASRRSPELMGPAFAGAVALSLFVSPHLLGHDLSLLAPALVLALAWLGQSRHVPAVLVLWGALSLAAQQDLGNASFAPPGRLTPWVLLLLSGGAAWIVLSRGERSWGGRRLALASGAPLPPPA